MYDFSRRDKLVIYLVYDKLPKDANRSGLPDELCKQFTMGMSLFMKNKESKIKSRGQFLGSRRLIHALIHALCMYKFS